MILTNIQLPSYLGTIEMEETDIMFGFLFKRKKLSKSAHKLFSQVIEQSRLPVFYQEFQVDDTLDGRFDVMSLHMALVLHKLDQHDDLGECKYIKRLLQETMFDNLDLTVREIGVGDMGVGKKIKAMAEAFYGSMMAYQSAMQEEDASKMSDVLHRNLYRERDIEEELLTKMSQYVSDQWDHFKTQTMDDVMDGHLSFIQP